MPSVLHLHKASAGSGKTYTLTRQYIEYLLTNDGQLSNRSQISDNLRHILAITFTNKATAEMKERIVSALSKLAYSDYKKKRPDYLDYLTELTGAAEEDVRAAAKTALSVLLNAYSDFNVSTIDSFFQTILRTFAYEIERSDSYEIELDSDFVARSAVDATLSDMNSDNPDRQVRNWLQKAMQSDADAGKAWNIFAKKIGGTYGQLLNAVEKMSSEDYKKHREELKKYLDAHRDATGKLDITNLYQTIDNKVKEKLQKHYVAMQDSARKVAADIGSYDEKKHLNKDLVGRVKKTLSYPLEGVAKPWTSKAALDDKFAFKVDKIKEGLSPADRAFVDNVIAMVESYRDWYEELHSEKLRTWELYSKNFKMLPMMSAAAELSAEQLARDNIIDMSETSTILDKVIGDQDSPFIFERIGNQLNHFLIDEFQDTSAMQWKVLKPLVSNSLSEGHSNLIIGDGKQSIYRFRGAEPSLIMKQVPQEFGYCASIKGDRVEDNTNYRSCRNIVEFNNTLFRLLAEEMDGAFANFTAGIGAPAAEPFFAPLYAGVTQRPNKGERRGYVQLLTYKKGSSGGFGGNQPEPAPHLVDIAAKISELHARGYRYSDIAVLVRRKDDGTNVIGAIIQWNNDHPDATIPFISEESLTVGSAPSVRILLSALTLIGEGDITRARQENMDEKDPEQKHRRPLSEALFLCSYAKFVHLHPEIQPEDLMAAYAAEEPDSNPLDFIVTDARNIELPALVEKLIGSLLTTEEQRKDAPYIAAFQDLVIDYCERHSADIRSFLQWWKQKGESKGINSPENIEAVKILTIHKAKGLQYRCVIIPELSAPFKPDYRKTEWLWVRPSAAVLGLTDATLLPEALPVESGEKMAETPHKDVYAEYRRLFMMDLINTWYVAFTRPVEELYIYALQKEEVDKKGNKVKEEPSLQLALREIFFRMQEGTAQGADGEYQLPAVEVSIIEESEEVPENQDFGELTYVMKATVGHPLSEAEIEAKNPKEIVAATTADEGYFEHDPGKFIQYRDVEFDYVDSENPDPQWEGNKMHDIMSRVNVPEDLEGAVRTMVVKGRITPREGERFLSVLRPAIEITGKEYGWFAPGLRVLNERSLLREGEYDRRPDRVIVDCEGRATVIDYKFGTARERGHISQVRRYKKLMIDTAAFTEVRGFLWYVNLQEVVEV